MTRKKKGAKKKPSRQVRKRNPRRKRITKKPRTGSRAPVTKRRKPRDYYFTIRGRLDQAKQRAKRAGVEGIIMAPVRNSDRSVTGEIRFIRPLGNPTRDFIIDVEGFISVPRGVWISVGGRFEPTRRSMEHVRSPTTSRYEREFGLINLGSFFQRGRQKAATFLAARKYVTQMEETLGNKPQEIYARLQYQPQDNQPSRIGTPINKRRKPRASKKLRKRTKSRSVQPKGRGKHAKRKRSKQGRKPKAR